MTSDVTCEKLREIGAELALCVLPGRERAGAVAHLEGCADCREHVRQLTEAGDRLIGLLPGSEPPVGFETRVAQALTQGAQRREGRARPRVTGPLGRRIRPRVAAAATAFVLAVGFGGWSVGTAVETTLAGPAPSSADRGTGLLWGGLTSARPAPGRPAGEVYAHPGSPGWVYMTVDLTAAGTPYTGKVTCVLVRQDGGTVRAGTFDLYDGKGAWGASAPPLDHSALAGARLTAADGTVLASTHFTPATQESRS
ncbi:hypothetical protein ABZ719_30640 [Streptomyces sp. NPDC006743]|uniref:hypothetical protein n=1 Tax=Streptomyces sp. NPDC006743 TaxID=3154480 RepID=UPI003451AD2B